MQVQAQFLRMSAQQGQYSPGQKQVVQKITSYYGQCIQFYYNPAHYEFVKQFIPVDVISKNAESMIKDKDHIFKTKSPQENQQEAFLCSLMTWFKNDFFSWLNSPTCTQCTGKTEPQGMTAPNAEDLSGGAYRVELYKCSTCGNFERFPRYNNPLVLLKSRRGRCGEWANTFTMICCSLGLEARLVFDMTDHLWTEVYIHNNGKGKWYHLDPCENIFDAPLVYEKGWGKKLNYIFGFTKSHVMDVSLRYTQSYENIKPQRTFVSEEWLNGYLYYFNFTILTGGEPHRIQWTEQARNEVIQRIKNEREELKQEQARRATTGDEVQPRQSGAEEWRRARGEMGNWEELTSIPSTFEKRNLRTLFDFAQFKSSACPTLVFNGDATTVNNMLRLTDRQNSQRGSCWYIQPISMESSLVTCFQFQILEQGADGFAFVLQAEGKNALGKDGGEKGFGGISKSIAIEFDTYENYSQLGDPNGNHISIHSRGLSPNSAHHQFSLGCATNLPCKLNDGNIHSVRIAFDAVHCSCFVEIDGKLVIHTPLDIFKLIGSEKIFVGFTGATGGISQTQLISNWSLFRPH